MNTIDQKYGIELDQTNQTFCEHCGRRLSMRMIKVSLGHIKQVPVGYELCDCPGANHDRIMTEQQELKLQEMERKLERDRMLERANIPKRYRHAKHKKADEMAKMASEDQSFYIHGKNGTYKTTLACAAAIQLAEVGRDVFFVSSYDLMAAMRNPRSDTDNLYERSRRCELLVLDDLGKEADNTQFACERLFAIIDTRYNNMLTTIITSNYKLSELAQHIAENEVGKAIASRLSATCKQVELTGKDKRLNQ